MDTASKIVIEMNRLGGNEWECKTLHEMDEMLKDSKLTEKDVDAIGHCITEKTWENIKKMT